MNHPTPLTAQNVAGLTRQSVPRKTEGLTPVQRTPKRRKARARRCQCGCQQTFTPHPKSRNQRFASEACRKRFHRRKAAKNRQPPPPELVLFECAYCQCSFLASKGRGARYCKASHRVAAHNARRSSAVMVLMVLLDYSHEQANDLCDLLGLKRVTSHLVICGFWYDERGRQWVTD